MSRANYSDDGDAWDHIRWRGAVTSAIRGTRGQALLREMLAALDVLPEPRLVSDELSCSDGVCALGSVGLRRGMDMSWLDPEDPEFVAKTFGVAPALVREIAYLNDEWDYRETPEQRFIRMRAWVVEKLKDKP